MPAAAVIPAPIAYIKIVAVKTLVVEFQRIDILSNAFSLIHITDTSYRLCAHFAIMCSFN